MKRMHYVATFLFILALTGSVIAWPFRGSFTGGLIFTACEAALVGALADWFAVVALFRHPMGLKFIPHTAIIPANRDRIIEGIVNIVESDWLSRDFIQSKILEYQIIDVLASALEKEEGRRALERMIQSVVNITIDNLDPEEAARFIHLMLAEHLDELKVSPDLIKSLEAAAKNLYADDLISLLLNWGISVTKGDDFERIIKRALNRAAADYSNQGGFLRRLTKGLGESLDILNYDEAADTIAKRLNHLLVEMKDPANHYRIKIKTEIYRLHIADPESAAAAISGFIKKMVNTDGGLRATTELIAGVKAQLTATDGTQSPVIKYISNIVIEQIIIIRQDETRKNSIENWIRAEIVGFIDKYHRVIGHIVREKLQSLNDIGLVNSLEERVGNDLQWIRINGTVIGALVGILQFLLMRVL